MAATISQVNNGIKTRLETISGLRVYEYEPDAFFPPLAYPSLNSIEYHRAMQGGNVVFDYTVVVVVGRVNERVASDQLDAYTSWDGAQSVRAAIEADRTLGGVVDTLLLSTGANISAMTNGESDFVKVEFSLTVYS